MHILYKVSLFNCILVKLSQRICKDCGGVVTFKLLCFEVVGFSGYFPKKLKCSSHVRGCM